MKDLRAILSLRGNDFPTDWVNVGMIFPKLIQRGTNSSLLCDNAKLIPLLLTQRKSVDSFF